MKRLFLILLTALMAAPTLAAAAEPTGVWRNRHDTVHIRTASCGTAGLCGTVIWASEKAKADVAKTGNTLVGATLFHGSADGDGSYSGRVYVPDLGRTFSGRLKLSGPDTLVARGCLIAGFICKSTTWVRVTP